MSHPNDAHERQARDAADTVMRGGRVRVPCPQAQTRLAGSSPEIFRELAADTGVPLNAELSATFGARFGHDFSCVRVHASGAAMKVAEDLEARALTVGRNIVLGAQLASALSGPEGRHTLAHELAHVVQQGGEQAAHGWQGPVMREPKPQQRNIGADERKRYEWLEELAVHPDQAHDAWKRLNTAQRVTVLEGMRRRYGGPFAEQFLDLARKGHPQNYYQYFPRGEGPTPKQLLARGFRKAGIMGPQEVWVHPSGTTIGRSLWPQTPGSDTAEKQPGREKPESGGDEKHPPASPSHKITKQERAEELLVTMRNKVSQLRHLSESDPIPWPRIRGAYSGYTDAQKELNTLFADPQNPQFPDFGEMDDYDETFSDELEMLEREFVDLYDEFSAKNPGFMSGVVED